CSAATRLEERREVTERRSERGGRDSRRADTARNPWLRRSLALPIALSQREREMKTGQGRPMQTWLRMTLLALCTGVGVAVALAVALHQPDRSSPARDEPAAEPAAKTTQAHKVPPSAVAMVSTEPQPIVAPYRDVVARQVGQLEESILQ